MAVVAWLVSRRLVPGRIPAAVAVVFVAVVLARLFSIRPSLVSTLAIMTSMLVMLHWFSTRRVCTLLLLVPLMWLAFNMHMAMGWYVILVPGTFMLADVVLVPRGRVRHLLTYMGVVATQCAVTFANPWGVDGVAFLVKAMGVARYNNGNAELRSLPDAIPLMFAGLGGNSSLMFPYVALGGIIPFIFVIVAVARYRSWRRLGDVERMTLVASTLIAVGLSVVSFGSIREFSTFIVLVPLCVPFATAMLSSVRARLGMLAAVSAVLVACYATAFSGYLPWNLDYLRGASMNPDTLAGLALVEGQGIPKGTRINTDEWVGPRLTFMGYRPTEDMRPELSSSAITGLGEDHLREVVDAKQNADDAVKYVGRYKTSFQWFVYRDGGTMAYALRNDPDIKPVATRSGVTLYESTVYKR